MADSQPDFRATIQPETRQVLDDLKHTASRSLDESISMPPTAFTSEELLELERERIFSKEWICVARTDELPSPGAYLTSELNGVPIVIAHDLKGEFQALVNICRHRMAQVASGSGKARVLTCPYHNWAYGLDGRLMNAPKMSEKPFDKSDCGLKTLSLEIWEGFIFVNVDKDAESLAPRLAGLKQTLKNYGMSEMNTIWREEQTWGTNWKIACENFLEAYHIETLHVNNLFAYVGGAENTVVADTSDYYTFYKMHGPEMQSADMFQAMKEVSLPGELTENPDLTDHDYKWSYVGAIFPGMLLVASWWGSTIFSVQPLGTGKSKVLYLVFAPVTGIQLNSEEAKNFHVKYLNDEATEEDKVIVSGIQRNAESGLGSSGPLHIEHEKTIYNFIRYLSSKLSG
ncbi:MAG: aromatic ring-hydroxylating dioxygenase subunit alpha [Pseudomonadota bacterium]